MEAMLIRSERPGDVEAIYEVHRLSFSSPLEAEIVNRLRKSGCLAVSLVAEATGAVVGHVAFSPVTTSRGDTGAGLGPIAVWEPYRRAGIGRRLVEEGLAACRSAGFGWAVVLGDPAYYSRLGFNSAARFGLSDEFGCGEAFQAIELRPGLLAVGGGLVRYSEEFGGVGLGHN